MADEQKFLIKVSQLSKCDEALVVPSLTLVVTETGLTNQSLLPDTVAELGRLLNDFPAVLSPMTNDEIEEYKETLTEAGV